MEIKSKLTNRVGQTFNVIYRDIDSLSERVKGPPFFRHSFYSNILSDSAGAKQIPSATS